jgi:hypothetical protein
VVRARPPHGIWARARIDVGSMHGRQQRETARREFADDPIDDISTLMSTLSRYESDLLCDTTLCEVSSVVVSCGFRSSFEIRLVGIIVLYSVSSRINILN